MNPFPSLLTAIAAVLLTLVNVSAQNEEVELQFVSFPKVEKAESLELISGEGETILVELPTNSLSPVYKVKRMPNWVIGKSTKNDKGETQFDIYGQAPALASKTQMILVMRDGVNDADGLKLIPIDGEKDGFSGGKYLFVNATKINVGGTVGETVLALEPQSHEILAPVPSKVVEGRKYLFTKLYFIDDQEEKAFHSSTWRFNDNARSIVFFYQTDDDQHVRLHIIRNYL